MFLTLPSTMNFDYNLHFLLLFCFFLFIEIVHCNWTESHHCSCSVPCLETTLLPYIYIYILIEIICYLCDKTYWSLNLYDDLSWFVYMNLIPIKPEPIGIYKDLGLEFRSMVLDLNFFKAQLINEMDTTIFLETQPGLST